MKKLLIPFLLLTGFFILIESNQARAQNSWNTAAVFDGNCYIKEMVGALNNASGEMTVEFWMKPAADNSSYSIIGKNQFRILTSSGKIRVQVSGTTLLNSTAEIDTGQWTHVAVTFSNTNNAIKIYLNGSLDNTLSTFSGSFAATTDTLVIGKSVYGDNLEGGLDEVRIWKTVRTASEIQNNFKIHLGWYGNTYYDNNLIYCRTFDFDVYSPGFYLPYGGATGTFGSDILGKKPSKTVLHNNSIFFTGSSYLEATTSNDPDISLTGPMTVEAWIYPSTIGTTQPILDLTQGGGGYKMTLESSGKISWAMGGNQGTGNTVLTANKWYHVAVVCGTPSGGTQTAYIYINGTQDAGYNYNQLVINTGKLRVGTNSTATNFFSGYIDEVRISNYSKTLTEIIRYLHTPILYINKPDPPNITVAYNFDGNIYSGTRDGSLLKNYGCRFSYANDPYSPMFHIGYPHESLLDSLSVKHPFLTIPSTGTAGYTYDTLLINQSIAIEPDKMKVFVSLNHGNIHDLKIELIGPENDSVVLTDQVSLPTKEITCIFSGQAGELLSSSFFDNAPITGPYDNFGVFNGKNSQGVWKLKITDLANGNTGVLNSWGLLFSGGYFSVNEYGYDDKPLIYPNPSAGRFVVDMKVSSNIINTLEVFNLLGAKVYQTQLTGITSEIDLMGQPGGVYLARISNGTKTYLEKIVIQ
ncbi:MAG TPA: T9SS type A sorting domain-containing protein [Bacteroidales bacterium]|nr:T9SS type A sorting domain-containing protein [Bacteroidales bacterium]